MESTMKVAKTKRRAENGSGKLRDLSFRLKGIIPVLFMLQGIKGKPPEYILEMLSNLTNHDSWKILNKEQLKELRTYLEKWELKDFTKE